MGGISLGNIDLVIVWTDPPTGFLAISAIPKGERQGEETDEQLAARIAAKDAPPGVTSWAIVSNTQFPQDKTFRQAWQHNAGKIEIDLPKAKAIHRGRLLAARDAKLQGLREEVEAATDGGDNARANQARSKRKALRDLETKIDADLAGIATVDDLKKYRPAELN